MAKRSAGASCAGCFLLVVICGGGLGVVGMLVSSIELPKSDPTDPHEKELVPIYAATEDMICATDKNFLDSSPLVSPANFARVAKGTEVYIADMGGMFSGKMYYGLSAGGGQIIYVYQNVFEQRFIKVDEVER